MKKETEKILNAIVADKEKSCWYSFIDKICDSIDYKELEYEHPYLENETYDSPGYYEPGVDILCSYIYVYAKKSCVDKDEDILENITITYERLDDRDDFYEMLLMYNFVYTFDEDVYEDEDGTSSIETNKNFESSTIEAYEISSKNEFEKLDLSQEQTDVLDLIKCDYIDETTKELFI